MSLSPSQISYLHAALPFRLDARKPLETIPRVLSRSVFPHASGSARVTVGKDDVMVGVSVECENDQDDDEDEQDEKDEKEGQGQAEGDTMKEERRRRNGRIVVDVEAYL
jgi:ribonuclease PH